MVDATTPETIRHRLRYAGDVLYTDSEIARLLEHLDEIGETERTVVIVTADHGEALGEHGIVGHGWNVSDSVLHIPLIMRAPGLLPEGLLVSAPVSLVDLAPTLLELAGVPAPPTMQGSSLLDLVQLATSGAMAPDRTVFAERVRDQNGSLDLVARRRTEKLLSNAKGTSRYDVVSDPTEDRPVSDPEVAVSAASTFADYRAANERVQRQLGDPVAAASAVDPVTQDKLRALGYTN